jgi:hypothetical protein
MIVVVDNGVGNICQSQNAHFSPTRPAGQASTPPEINVELVEA